MTLERPIPSERDFAALGMAVTACAGLENTLRYTYVLTKLNGKAVDVDHQPILFGAHKSGLPNLIRHINIKVESSQELTQPEKNYLNTIFKGQDGSSIDCNFVVWRNVLCHAPMAAIDGGKLYFRFSDQAVFLSLPGSNPYEKETSHEELRIVAKSFSEASRLLRLAFVER
ncbi:hypothetical protein [Pacificibacter marinus]|uniref:Uncharacterized protein n=1 Tax=Pacificibacter marinus TaxID=658057 RepID=A0A1Y5S8Y8_9RHOB|nr:hypothetical protein [Pacificibacter marinus]SEK80279.1 hypothetical protein SAMN04488032_106217 [Pacificibacter marinus]SLN32758.1 hypothetical protein PAM7971_01336 [Pacificibacter marinus]